MSAVVAGLGLLLLVAIGVPIYVALIGGAATLTMWDGGTVTGLGQRILDKMNSATLMAIPFFVIAAGFIRGGGMVTVTEAAPLSAAVTLVISVAVCLLFVPGDRPERFAKARAAAADGIVIDLEDAVAPDSKPAARPLADEWLAARASAKRAAAAILRLNPAATRPGLDDLCCLADGRLAADALMLAKVEHPGDVALVRAHDPAARPLAVTVETALGLRAAASIADTLRRGDALVFGGADLAADLDSAFAWEPLLAARCALVQAASGAGVAALDVPWLDLADAAGLASEAGRARALGFTGKIAIHPTQVAPIRAAFAPSADELVRARRIVSAMATGSGAARIDGRMVDAALERAARRMLARAPDPS